jgi:hypothetical protein
MTRLPIPAISTSTGIPVRVRDILISGSISVFTAIPDTATLLTTGVVNVLPSSWSQDEQYKPTNGELASAPILDARLFSITQVNNSIAVILGTLPYSTSPAEVAFIGGLLRTVGDPNRVHNWWYNEFGSNHCLDILLPPWVVVDGVRIDNCTDGIGTRSQFGGYDTTKFRISNCWIRKPHDDGIENDQFQSLLVQDCLIEECYMGISMR